MLERMKTEESFNILEFVQELRKKRVHTVQTLVKINESNKKEENGINNKSFQAQYMFIHDTLKELLIC